MLGAVMALTLGASALTAQAKDKDKDKDKYYVVATPLPAAFWPGVATLGAIGAFVVLRKRKTATA